MPSPFPLFPLDLGNGNTAPQSPTPVHGPVQAGALDVADEPAGRHPLTTPSNLGSTRADTFFNCAA